MSGWDALDRLLDSAPGEWSVCVQRPNGEAVYAYAADAVRPAASLIKVPLAMALIESDKARRDGAGLDLTAGVTLREEDRVEGDGTFDAAPVGTTRTRWELLGHTLRESDNTAGNLLIATIGMDAVNRFMRAAPYRLRTTCLRRRFMDFTAATAGRENLTTAREMCALFAALLAPEAPFAPILEWLKCSPYDARLVAGLPAGTVVAHKVGDLAGVEHDVGIVYAPGGPYIAALLSVNLPAPNTGTATIAEASRLIYQLVH